LTFSLQVKINAPPLTRVPRNENGAKTGTAMRQPRLITSTLQQATVFFIIAPNTQLYYSPCHSTMSFDQLSSLESQPTTTRRQDDPQYADDPEFQRLSQELMDKLFILSGNISRLSNEIALLGTKRDTERVRERVHDLLEESKDTFKEVGEGVKTIQAWEDVSVGAALLSKETMN
jgi:hypothetical protein